MDTHRVGAYFEDLAARWLERRGWHVLGRNVRFGRKEIDLVARRHDLVAFVEVKGRRTGAYGAPAEAVTPRKRGEIESVARWWVERWGRPDLRYRFDVIGIAADGHGGFAVDHVEDAWRPG